MADSGQLLLDVSGYDSIVLDNQGLHRKEAYRVRPMSA
jgi:hypothetical protein